SQASGQLRQFRRTEDDHDDEDHDRDLHETWFHWELLGLLMLWMILRCAAEPFILIRTRFSSSAEPAQGLSHSLGVVDVGDDIGMAEQEPAQPVDRMDQEADAYAGVTVVEVFTFDHLEFIGQPRSGGRQTEGDLPGPGRRFA